MFIVAEYFLDFLVLEGHPDSIWFFLKKVEKNVKMTKNSLFTLLFAAIPQKCHVLSPC